MEGFQEEGWWDLKQGTEGWELRGLYPQRCQENRGRWGGPVGGGSRDETQTRLSGAP